MAELVKIIGEELDEDVREAGPKTPVVFLKSASPYAVGEIAGFGERVVDNLVDRRVARRLKDAELAKLTKTQEVRAQAHAEAAAASMMPARVAG